jgi:hypothetical protein
VGLVRTNVSEERIASTIRVTTIGELRTMLAVTSQHASVASYGCVLSSPILVTLMMEASSFSVTSFLTTATRLNMPEIAILHSHRRETSNPTTF